MERHLCPFVHSVMNFVARADSSRVYLSDAKEIYSVQVRHAFI